MAALLVAYLLATGRWGTHISVPGTFLYITDAVLGLSLLAATAAAVRIGPRRFMLHVRALPAALPVLVLLSWVVIRWAASPSSLSLTALRDVAPYGYGVVFFLGILARPRFPVTRLVVVGLLVHLVGVGIVVGGADWAAELPVVANDVRIGSIRSDFDLAVIGVLMSFATWRYLRDEWRIHAVALIAISVLAVSFLDSRAGLLALVASLLIAVVASPLRQQGTLARGLLVAVVVVASMVAGSRTYGGNDAVSRFLATVIASRGTEGGDPSDAPESDVAFGALGTLNARLISWRLSLEYILDQPDVMFVGRGFGPDFLNEAGADVPYEGGVFAETRHPHNYLINTWARLGLVGVGLLFWVLVHASRSGWRVVRHAWRSTGDRMLSPGVLALLISSALFVASLLGVILEAPFGAVPFFWALGVLALSADAIGVRQREPA